MQTQRLYNNSQGIDYIYNHGRLTDITTPNSASVHYDYDAAGRVAKRWDASGTEEFTYDALGNVIGSTRRMAVPTESNVYVFHTGYKYDSYGRMQQITYPDGEQVDYHYGAGGLLADMVSSIYDTICIRQYDERGQRVYQKYGNGTETFYQYSSYRNWLTDLTINNSVGTFSEKHYAFDAVGNVSSLSVVEGLSGSIASWNATYTYDNRNRLISGTGPYTYTVTHSPTGKLFRKSFDNLPSSSVSTPTGLIYGYDQDSLTHQPRVLYDTVSQSALELFWDADGNLAEMLDCDRNKVRLHRWNDFDRLTLSLGHDFCGYYGYDADGIRTYKLTGTCKMDDVNGGDIGAQAIFDDMVLYPSPFVVVTPRGYTNHYYAGSERIASRIGNRCWLHDPFVSYEKPSPEWTALEEFQNLPNENYPFGRTDDWSDVVKNSTPIQDFLEKVQYPCPPVDLKQLNVLYSEDMLHDVMDCKTPTTNIVPVYYYHPDHLGSTSWVTDEVGNDFHFLAYMPYGEPFMDKHPAPYDTRYGQDFARYQFTGKERDAETGYDYIEQRYYWWPGGFWLRPDPLLDKYLNLSPYAYCNGNPLKYVDPDGRVWESFWDAAWILWDGASFLYNTIVGNDQEAAMDAACFTADCATLLVPFAPALSGPARASAKLAPKVAEATPKVAKAIDKIITATKNTYRQALQKATGKMGKGFEAHHTLPQKYRDRFEKLGINIDEPGNVVWRKTEDHKAGNAEHGRAWDKFFKDNPSPTKEQVLEFRDQTEQKVWGNIGDSPLQ